MSICIFIGSTLTHARAKTHLDATYLPPVQQGDVLRILADKPRVIGIVDGMFRTVPSVWHKEILVALEQGVHVFGAASMGALRAAELARFGMRGVGRIYERFADGTYEDDDEVAVAHASAEFGFRELSVAMVNIRDAVEQALQRGLIDAERAARIVREAKAAHYTRRRLDPALSPEGPSLKQRDAIEMLEAIGAFMKDDPPPFAGAVAVERTPFLHALQVDVDTRRAPRRVVEEGAAGVPLWALRKEAFTQILARNAAAQLGITVTDEELAGARQQFREGAKLEGPIQEIAWLRREGMTVATLEERLRDIVRVQKLEEHYGRRVDLELPDLAAVLPTLIVR